MHHTTSHTTAAQSPSHHQRHIPAGIQWHQLPELTPCNSNSAPHSQTLKIWQKPFGGRGFTPDLARRAYSALPDSLAVGEGAHCSHPQEPHNCFSLQASIFGPLPLTLQPLDLDDYGSLFFILKCWLLWKNNEMFCVKLVD